MNQPQSNEARATADGRFSPPDDSRQEPLPPFVMVIFGASGDLAKRKLLPALWKLHCRGRLSDNYAIIGYARSDLDDKAFEQKMRQASFGGDAQAPCDEQSWHRFARHLHYLRGQYDSAEDFDRLEQFISRFETPGSSSPRIYYLSTPPSAYEAIVDQAGRLHRNRRERLNDAAGATAANAGEDELDRIVIEKPHGTSLSEARRLDQLLARHFSERSTFRIDHYLGKETVQNILILRFANTIFEPLWNRNYISCVQISAGESDGVGSRGGFYEQSGALRDMVQMHLLHLAVLVAMEQPASFSADDLRDEKAKALRMLRPITPDIAMTEAVRGQYGPGLIDGRPVPGYRQEEGVDRHSNTETYAAMRVWFDNWRWQGVPFYLRTGKRLQGKSTTVAIHFRSVPTCLFGNRRLCQRLEPNVLTLRVQPHEGVHFSIAGKVPGEGLNVGGVKLDFNYADVFGRSPAEAYETLLADIVAGDPSLFARRDQVELSWQFVEPVLDAWRNNPADDFPNYAAGSHGPGAADHLLNECGHVWRQE